MPQEGSPGAVRATFVFDREGICRAALRDLAAAEDHAPAALDAVRALARPA